MTSPTVRAAAVIAVLATHLHSRRTSVHARRFGLWLAGTAAEALADELGAPAETRTFNRLLDGQPCLDAERMYALAMGRGNLAARQSCWGKLRAAAHGTSGRPVLGADKARRHLFWFLCRNPESRWCFCLLRHASTSHAGEDACQRWPIGSIDWPGQQRGADHQTEADARTGRQLFREDCIRLTTLIKSRLRARRETVQGQQFLRSGGLRQRSFRRLQ
jgi:hypothetical protein